MKKLLSLLLIFSFVLVPGVLAEEASSSADYTEIINDETEDIDATLPSAGINPNSPWYFLDTMAENIGLAISRSPDRKAERAFLYAQEKLAELEEMGDEGDQDGMDTANEKHKGYMDLATGNINEAKALGKDVEALAEHVAEATLKHQAVLSRVYDKLMEKGNENAAAAVAKAMEQSMNGHTRAVQAINNVENKEKLENKGQDIKIKVREKMEATVGGKPCDDPPCFK